jgi:metallo-beta-lactamase class B
LHKRRWLLLIPVLLLAHLLIVGVLLFPKWRDASNKGGQKPAEPFRIAGNLYYVGANDVTAFLLTGPEGHILIDGGYPGTAPMIIGSVAQLGFNIKDVKILLNSHPHFDHAGGIAELQNVSGAQLWMSERDADIIADGGRGDPFMGPFKHIFPPFRYPAPRVDRRYGDGATIRVGPIALTAHITSGHTPGCTTFSFPVREGNRELRVVSACSLGAPPALSLGEYPEIRADFERSFRTLRNLPVDIWVTAHARHFGRFRKFQQRGQSADSVAPFIDREGYLAYIDSAEVKYRRKIAD